MKLGGSLGNVPQKKFFFFSFKLVFVIFMLLILSWDSTRFGKATLKLLEVNIYVVFGFSQTKL
jgi:hypothetical protein